MTLQITHGSESSLASGFAGGGYTLNGLHTTLGGNHIAFARDPILFGQDQLTVSMAFKTATIAKGGVLFKMNTALMVEATADGQVAFNLLANAAGERGTVKSTGLKVTDGGWHHFTLSYDATGHTMAGYVDGVFVGQIAVNAATKPAESWDPTIGDPFGKGFAGTVDNFEIHNHAITAAQALSEYKAVLKQLDVRPPTLAKLNFDNGALVEASGHVAVTAGKASSISDGAYYLNGKVAAEGGNSIALAKDASLFSKSQFSVSMDFKSEDVGVGGSLFRMHSHMVIDVTATGEVVFKLLKNAAGESGTVRVAADAADGEWHNATFTYDVTAGKMTAYVDGLAKGSIAISAPTLPAAYWDPMVGSPWAGGFRGFVDNVELSDGVVSPRSNPKPVAGNDMAAMDEGGKLTLTSERLLVNDFDPQGHPIAITQAKLVSGFGTVSLHDGDITFTPMAGWHGTAEIQYTVLDTLRAKDTAIVRVDVLPTSDAPQAAMTMSAFAATEVGGELRGIIINSSAELASALQQATGGEVFLLRSGIVYDPVVKGMLPHSAPVTVTSLDPNDMATITGLDLRNGNNVTFQNLKFEFWGTPGYQADVVVNGGEGIRFIDNVFLGQATSYAAIDSFQAQNALSISNTKNFEFSGNEVSHYMHGVAVSKSANVSIHDNDIHHMQGDGMRFAQMTNITVEGNKFHDFFGADPEVTHNDYIQFWTSNTTAPSTDVVIRGNVFLSGEFQPQAIFMRDELGDAGQTGTRFQRVLIEDNVIYNDNQHGITAPRVDGLTIRGNTIVGHTEGTGTAAITVENGTSVSVYDNVAPRIAVGSSNQVIRLDSNLIVQDSYPGQSGHSSNLFVNPLQGTGAQLEDLYVRPDAAIMQRADGTVVGSELLHMPVLPDVLTALFTATPSRTADGKTSYAFDARYSANHDGLIKQDAASFQWSFGDGTIASGRQVSHTFAEAGEYQVILSVLHNDGSNDTARLHASVQPGLDAGLDFDRGLAFQHHSTGELWGV